MKTVLFIEDNAGIRENMGEILELANYKVLLAPNGKEGVATALSQKPDIIICDIMMPELDGYGVIHLLQKNDETKQIPFIFLTAKAERAELRKGMELGADDYITKPFSGTELLNAIEGRLKKADLLKEEMNRQLLAANSPAQEVKNIEQVFKDNQDTNNYSKKQLIYSEGKNAFRLYQVQSGKIKTFKTNEDGKELITGIFQAGDFLGYTALLEGSHYTDSAEALEAAEVNSIPRELFEELLNSNPETARQFIHLLAGNIQDKEAQLLGLAYNSLRKKVAEALTTLHEKYRNGNRETVINISRENLASLAGTAKESLIRTLGDFRDEGIIEIKGSDIIVLQEKKLHNLAN